MADKLTQLVTAALSQAAAEPSGLPLLGTTARPGLFPTSQTGKAAASKVCAAGWLVNSTANRDRHVITPAGLAHLLKETNPRQILNDLARTIERREQQFDSLAGDLAGLRFEFAQINATIKKILETDGGELAESIALNQLDARQSSGAPDDCPLPELYRRLTESQPRLTIGGFHDCLRRMHSRGMIYLHPWTGPLYALPEPAFAILIGHEIAYYASRPAAAAVA